MARTPSNMLALGTEAPPFVLPNVLEHNKPTSFQDCKGQNGTVVAFICNHCPFVIHVIEAFSQLALTYGSRGFGFVAISSNDIHNYPQDAPEHMVSFAHSHHFSFPYLYDASQDVAKAYDAACTPDFYLFDATDQLAYRGQMDDSRPGNSIEVTGQDLKNALDALSQGQTPDTHQKPSIGCNIKWK